MNAARHQSEDSMEETALLVNLALAIGVAFLGGFIALRLGQSPMLGFIFGGMLIGPNTPGFVGDIEAVEALADIGIILLLFAIGIQISMRDLVRAGRIAVLGGSLQVVLTIGIGYLVGLALGWGVVESLFFGAVISNSSSTVLGKVLSDRGQADSTHGQVSLAWSSVQDLSTIALVVILTALAVGEDGILADLITAGALAGIFLILLLPIGSRVLPWFFERVATPENREIFIIAVAAFALGTAYLSTFFGLSLALGAFVAGIVVSESDLWHQILGEVMPLRDIFAALFFVSVGMFVDPGFIIRNLSLVLIVVALIVLVKGLLAFAISVAFRYPLRVAILIGVTLAQSAEFSFLLASLGADLDAISSETFSMMLAGAVISIILTPVLHKYGNPFAAWVSNRVPESDLARLPVLADTMPELRAHAIICGYGRVGRLVGEALKRRDLPFVVIEQDRTIVHNLRSKGIIALYGTADNPVLLERAHVSRARILVIAVPDALASRQIIEYAHQLNERIEIVARTHSSAESIDLRDRGVQQAVYAELELAMEITRAALQRFGIGTLEVQALLQRLRMEDQGDSRHDR
jgi:monovalent cation:H+ antiporter-2, CPA2 family